MAKSRVITSRTNPLQMAAGMYDILDRSGRALVHCKGGLGRAGMVATKMLIDYDSSAKEAIAEVRRARSPNVIETREQERNFAKLAERTVPIRSKRVSGDARPDSWVECCIKVLRMVGVLHARGYQRLRICPTGREMWWRCAKAQTMIFSEEHGALIGQETPSMTAQFGSGAGCRPFEWRESITDMTVDEPADRFARIVWKRLGLCRMVSGTID